MQSTIQNLREGAMDQNQQPRRPGGEMRSTQGTEPSKSQLLPFASNAVELTTKPYFIPGLVVALLVPLLFASLGSSSTVAVNYRGIPVPIPTYTLLLAAAITIGTAFAIYKMVGKPKAWWAVPAAAAFSGGLLSTPVIWTLQSLFRFGTLDVQPGDGMFIATLKDICQAGLPEEVYKAIPVLIGVYVGRRVMNKMNASHPSRQLAVVEPLDGILIGAASGLGFAFVETLFQYVPMVILTTGGVAIKLATALAAQHVSIDLPKGLTPEQIVRKLIQLIPDMYNALAGKIGPDQAALFIKQATSGNTGHGLELMIPRLLFNICGHSAYAGIFGYFIGLAAMKPSQWVKTVALGLLIAATLHGLWDATADTGGGTFIYMLIATASFIGMATLIMKGREISPNRSQLVASQIIDRMSAGLSRSQILAQPVGQPAPQPSVAQRTAPAPLMGRPVTAPAHSITYDDGPEVLVLEIGTARVPVSLGARLYERQAPGTRSSRGDGVIAEVNANPNDPGVLGIKNVSDQLWHVTTAEGERRDLVSGRSVRLLRGMRILMGDLTAQVR